MKRLWKYFGHYKKEAVLAPLFKFLEASFELSVPLIVASIIDKGIRGGDSDHIIHMSAVLVSFAVLGVVFALTAQYFAAKLALGYTTELRDDLFMHIIKFSHAEADIMGEDTLITRIINDTMQIQTGINLLFRLVLRSPLIVFGALFMAFMIDFHHAMIFTCIILLLFAVVFFIMKQNVIYYRNVQEGIDRILGKISENLSGVRVLRAFHSQKEEKKEFRKYAEELYIKQKRAGRLSGLMNPLTYSIINLGVIAILQRGAIDIGRGNLSGGEVVALINYMGQILVELLKLANLIILLSKSLACAKRVSDVFELKTSLKDGNLNFNATYKAFDKKRPLIEFQHVNFAYPLSGTNTIEDISFQVMRGETIGIIGGTGSGKTTLINMLPRFYDSTKGCIQIAGHNIKEYSLATLRESIAIVEQSNHLFQGSIASNLRWGKSNAGIEEMEKAAEVAQAKEFIGQKTGGFNSSVARQGRNFSGGQKQRLSIARAIIKDPDILILDDASSALDYLTDARLREEIAKLKNDLTVFIVSQRVAGICNADKIIVLDEGRTVGIGTHKELLESCKIYQEICRSQAIA